MTRSWITLDERDRAMLDGELGSGAALAMRVLLATSRAMKAAELIPVTNAHVDGCIYIGSVSVDFARALSDGGAHVAVPTTLNVGAVDLLHPEHWKGDAQLASNGRVLMDLYRSLGCSPTWTCAPYQLAKRPGLGEHIAWGESNAIVFANSVLGARTQRYGDFVDISAAIVGKAPKAGLHLDECRYGDLEIDVSGLPGRILTRESFFPLLGHLVARWSGSLIPVVTGIPGASEDQMKAFGAATASAGAVAMFHMVGITPEAPTRDAAFGGKQPRAVHRVTESDLRRAWNELCTRKGGALGAVCLGTPHFSITEFERLVDALDGRSVHDTTPMYVNTGRYVAEQLAERGFDEMLRASGVRLVTDTCTYTAPMIGEVNGLVMTNSAKWAWYAPRNIGVEVLFAELDTCVQSAVLGRIVNNDLF
jgi:predicted aconitase